MPTMSATYLPCCRVQFILKFGQRLLNTIQALTDGLSSFHTPLGISLGFSDAGFYIQQALGQNASQGRLCPGHKCMRSKISQQLDIGFIQGQALCDGRLKQC